MSFEEALQNAWLKLTRISLEMFAAQRTRVQGQAAFKVE